MPASVAQTTVFSKGASYSGFVHLALTQAGVGSSPTAPTKLLAENCRKSHNREYDSSKAVRWQDTMGHKL